MNKTLRRTLSAIALSALLTVLTLTPVMAAPASTSGRMQQITMSSSAPAAARQLQQKKSPSSIDRNVLRSGRLIFEGGNIRYLRSNGFFLQNGWRKYHGKKYYFDSRGYAVKGMQTIKNKRYIFDSAGVMQKGWLKSSGKWYYLKPSGAMQTGSCVIGGKIYHFNTNGACLNP
jgi:hypothetical protein